MKTYPKKIGGCSAQLWPPVFSWSKLVDPFYHWVIIIFPYNVHICPMNDYHMNMIWMENYGTLYEIDGNSYGYNYTTCNSCFHICPYISIWISHEIAPIMAYVLARSWTKISEIPLLRFLRSMAAQMVGRRTGLVSSSQRDRGVCWSARGPGLLHSTPIMGILTNQHQSNESLINCI
jgi:hypothetical protein